MTPSGPADTLGTLAYRVGQVEAEVRSFREELGRAQHSILDRIDGLSYVRGDLYESEKRGLVRDMETLRDAISTTRAIAMWALGVVVSGVVGAVIVTVFAAAQ